MEESPRERNPELFDLPLIAEQLTDNDFIERQWLKDRIEAELAGSNCRIVLVTGAAGMGKTTLAAWLADQHPEWLRYFIRRGGEADDLNHRHEGGLASFLTNIGLQLAALHPDAFPSLEERVGLEGEIAAGEVAQGGNARAIWVH